MMKKLSNNIKYYKNTINKFLNFGINYNIYENHFLFYKQAKLLFLRIFLIQNHHIKRFYLNGSKII